MQRLFILLVLLCSGHINLYAQQFAPLGAEWLHNAGTFGIFHAQVKKDTVVSGVTCRPVIYTPYTTSPYDTMGLKYKAPLPLYVYNTEDTVFVYNSIFKKFTPLHVFNVNEGDTVTLPLLPPEGCAAFMNGYMGDSTFSFVVDSIRMVLYDTATLQTVFTHPLSIPGKQKMSFPNYARVLGNTNGWLLPYCDSCIYSLSESCSGPRGVRCYKDGNYFIKLVTDDCAKNVKVSVPVLDVKHISLYPNPATDKVAITSTSTTVFTKAQIVSVDGRMLHEEQQASIHALNLVTIPSGFYFVKLYSKSEQIITAPLLIQK